MGIFKSCRSPARSASVGTRIEAERAGDRKSTRLNSSHGYISYAVFCLKKKKKHYAQEMQQQDTHESTILYQRQTYLPYQPPPSTYQNHHTSRPAQSLHDVLSQLKSNN